MKSSKTPLLISNPGKILFPKQKFTKQDLVDYYSAISGHILPYLKNRPVMLHRFPQGINQKGFYQKDIGVSFPAWINRIQVPRENQPPIEQAVLNTKKALLYAVNQNTLTFHPWLSTVKDLNKPDKLIFDLDPAENGFKIAVKAAMLLKDLLEKKYGLNCFVMTTGSSGLHITIPLKATEPFDVVRPFARAIGEELSRLYPNDFTTEQRIEDRGNRLYIDYMRNSYAQTAVAPYAVRALPDAPVATPLFWDELADKDLKAQQYSITTIPMRLEETGNPWAEFRKNARSLKKALLIQQTEK